MGPAKRLGERVVEVVDEGGEFALEILDRGEVAAAEHFAREDGEPRPSAYLFPEIPRTEA
jgi:hypothetical protein